MSIKRNCQYCGKKISIRKMPEGHWLAFDYRTNEVHKCNSNKKATDKEQGLFQDANNNNISEVLSLIQLAINSGQDIHIKYFTQYRREWTNRNVTPLRLYTKNNSIYLDAYCHWRGENRKFKVSRIESVYIIPKNEEVAATKDVENPYSQKQNTSLYTEHSSKKGLSVVYFLFALAILIIFYLLIK